MSVDKKVSFILPTLNEEGNISGLINEIKLNAASFDYEIVVVDDASNDATCEAVIALESERVKLFRRSSDHGLALSIKHGIEMSSGEILVIMDSDFNHDPKYISFMLESVKHYDCVSASRFLYGGEMESRLRQILSWLFNVFIRFITAGRISDNLYGYFAVKREVIEKYCDMDKVFYGYGDYYMRLLYCLQKNELRILEFPAVNGKRRAGKGNRKYLKTFLQYTVSALKLGLLRSGAI